MAMTAEEIAILHDHFPSHNVEYLATVPDAQFAYEMDAAHAIYGECMSRNGGLSTRAHRVESILKARKRFLALSDEGRAAMRAREARRFEHSLRKGETE